MTCEPPLTWRGLGSREGVIRMGEYRVYAIGHDGHIFNSAPLICEGDKQAIEQAKAVFDNCTIEVWSGARFIVRLEFPASRGPN